MAEQFIASKQLPYVLQSTKLKNFFDATVDQWFKNENSSFERGFVGQKQGRILDTTQDAYLGEPTVDRANYQLEPTAVVRDAKTQDILYQTTYEDMVNSVRFDGGNIIDPSRLFESDYYSFAPPIDIDKFLNYSNYYWYPINDDLTDENGYSALPSKRVQGTTSASITLPTDIVGKQTYTAPDGTVFTNGLHVSFEGSYISPSSYQFYYTVDSLSIGNAGTGYTTSDTIMIGSTEVGKITTVGGSGEITAIEISSSVLPDGLLPSSASINTSTGSNGVVTATHTQKTIGFIIEGVGKEIKLVDTRTLRNISDSTEAKKDYITIERGAKDGNLWSKSNGWVHADTLNSYPAVSSTTETNQPWDVSSWDSTAFDAAVSSSSISFTRTSARRATRPIIEFKRDIELYDYGKTHLKDVTVVETILSKTQVEGNANLVIDGHTVKNQDTILFINASSQDDYVQWDGAGVLWDHDIDSDISTGGGGLTGGDQGWDISNTAFNVSSSIWKVSGVGTSIQLTQLVSNIDNGDKVYVEKGNNYKGTEWYYDGYNWNQAQLKSASNQSPLYNLYDNNKVILDDVGIYPGSSFVGSKIFGYKQGTGTNDTELGFPLSYVSGKDRSDIQFCNFLHEDTHTYNSGNITGYNYYKEFLYPETLSKIIDFEVNVNPSSSDANKNKFYIDNDETPSLILVRGNTYNFRFSSPESSTTGYSNANHPFYISTGTAWSSGAYTGEYTGGVTGSRAYYGGTSSKLIFKVPSNAPDNLYYHCGNHNGMGGRILVVDNPNSTITDATETFYKNEWLYNRNLKQRLIQQHTVSNKNLGDPVVLEVLPTSVLDMEVFKNGDRLKFGIDFTMTNSVAFNFVKDLVEGDFIKIFYKTNSSTPIQASNYFEIPKNLENNSPNDELGTATYSEFFQHFKSIVLNQRDFVGSAIGINNYRDTAQDIRLGNVILQHTAPLLKPMAIAYNSDININRSLTYNEERYHEFQLKFLNAVNNIQNSKDTSGLNIAQIVDEALTNINVAKNITDPFAYSRMLASGDRYITETHNITATNRTWGTQSTFLNLQAITQEVFNAEPGLEISSAYDPDVDFNTKALYVYNNNVQLVQNHNYIVDSSSSGTKIVFLGRPSDKPQEGDVITIRYYETLQPVWIPNTPASVGASRLYQPMETADSTTYSSGTRNFIQCHDGSLVLKYNDLRDSALLELEKRIYNTMNFVVSDQDRLPLFDVADVVPNKFSPTSWSKNDIDNILRPEFVKWANRNAINYQENTGYGETITLDATENYTVSSYVNGTYDTSNTAQSFQVGEEIRGTTSNAKATVVSVNADSTTITVNNVYDTFEINEIIIGETSGAGKKILTDVVDWKVLNYSSLTDQDGVSLPGHWRGIYRWYYGTDRPHTHPWEMLGFSQKPIWWDQYYAWTSPSVRAQLVNDIEQGIIRSGVRENYSDRSYLSSSNKFKKPGFSSYVPVDSNGQLLSPLQIGIISTNPSKEASQHTWLFGDGAPVENAFHRSLTYDYALQKLLYLTNPGSYVEKLWNVHTITSAKSDVNQLIDTTTGKRPSNKNYLVHTAVDDAGTRSFRSGVQNFISDYVISTGNSVNIFFGDIIRNIQPNLMYRCAGFIDTTKLQIESEAYDSTSKSTSIIIPDEDINVNLYTGSSIQEQVYSALIVELTTQGYKVYGYNTTQPSVKIYKPVTGSSTYEVRVGGKEIVPAEYKVGLTYHFGEIVKYQGQNYKCTVTHVSNTAIPENTKWVKISKLPMQGGTAVERSRQFDYFEEHTVEFGTVYKTRQEVYDVIVGYGMYLENSGWVFDQHNSDVGENLNWDYAAKEFLFWSLGKWDIGNYVTLSPSASQIKFKPVSGVVQNLTDVVNGSYSVLNKEGFGLNVKDISVLRNEDEVTITHKNGIGIYGLRVYIKETEHAIILNNKTIFNDTIYNTLLAQRQPRVKLSTVKTLGWTGKLEAEGFIIDNTTLINNFEKSVKDTLDFYDVDAEHVDTDFRDAAMHLIGYQQRDYLTNLGISKRNQIKLYQGMIKQKGTTNAVDRLLRSTKVSNDQTFDTYEEWAFKVGDFGSTNFNQQIELRLRAKDVVTDPLMFEFLLPTDSTTTAGYDSITDETVTIDIDDTTRWLKKPHGEKTLANLWPTISTVDSNIPSAGYVHWSDATYKVFDSTALDNLYGAQTGNVAIGSTAWVAKDVVGGKDWNAYKLYDLGTKIDNIVANGDANTAMKVTVDGTGATIGSSKKVMLHKTYDGSGSLVIDPSTWGTHTLTLNPSTPTPPTATIPFANVAGSGAQLAVGNIAGTVATVTSTGGTGFSVGDIITFTGTTGSGATATVGAVSGAGAPTSLTLNSGGSNYSAAPNGFTVKNSSGATQTLGTDYTAPTFTFTGNGTGGRFGEIKDFVITAGGTNYQAPTVTVVASTGASAFTLASNVITVTNGAITNIAVALGISGNEGFSSGITSTATGEIKVKDSRSNFIVNLGTGLQKVHQLGNLTANVTTAYDGTSPSVVVEAWDGSTATTLYTVPTSNLQAVASANISPGGSVTDNSNVVVRANVSVSSATVGAITLTLNYTSKQYDVTKIDGTPEFVTTADNTTINSSGIQLLDWKDTRLNKVLDSSLISTTVTNTLHNFLTGTGLNPSVWSEGDLVWLDDDSTGKWGVYRFTANASIISTYNSIRGTESIAVTPTYGGTWILHSGVDYDDSTKTNATYFASTKRRQSDKVNTNQFEKSVIYNDTTNVVDVNLVPYDPAKGILPPEANREIEYKSEIDPAVYTNHSMTGRASRNTPWTRNHVGEVWWDLSTTRYIDYETHDNAYRRTYWGRLFPGSSVDIYEWIESTKLPKDYDGTGTVRSTTNYVEDTSTNQSTGATVTKYYYWVKDVTTVPKLEGRVSDASTVANVIKSPISQGLNYFAPISQNALSVANVLNYTTDANTVLQLNYRKRNAEDKTNSKHAQWLLIKEDYPDAPVPDQIWNKMVDSLIGYDRAGATVPDTTLSINDRYGSKIRPRQSWFKNSKDARKVLHEALNLITTSINLDVNYSGWDTDLTTANYYERANWYYNTSFSDDTVIDLIVNYYTDIDTSTLLRDQVIKVNNGYNSKWELWQYTDADFLAGTTTTYDESNLSLVRIGLQTATAKLKTNVYTEADSTAMATELRAYLTAFRDKVFVSQNLKQQNILLFAIIRYVNSEQPHVDWLFKSTYLNVIQKDEELTQKASFQKDPFDDIKTYIEEVKPYRSKIRNFLSKKSPVRENANMSMSDFTDSSDYALNSTSTGTVNPAPKVSTKLVFDRISTDITLVSPSTNIINDWDTGQNYTAGTSIKHKGGYWQCTVNHTSGTFVADVEAGKWQHTNFTPTTEATDVAKINAIKSSTPTTTHVDRLAKYYYATELAALDTTDATAVSSFINTLSNKVGFYKDLDVQPIGFKVNRDRIGKELTNFAWDSLGWDLATLSTNPTIGYDNDDTQQWYDSRFVKQSNTWKPSTSYTANTFVRYTDLTHIDAWSASTSYTIGDIVKDNGKVYVANVTHKNLSSETTLVTSRWDLITDQIYYTNANHTSASTFEADYDAGKWILVQSNLDSAGFARPQHDPYPEELLPITPKESLIVTVQTSDGTNGNKAPSTIVNATKTNPVVITTQQNHNLSNGDEVQINGMTASKAQLRQGTNGMTQLNDNNYIVANVTARTFELQGVNGTSFGTYQTGGIATPVIEGTGDLSKFKIHYTPYGTVEYLRSKYVDDGSTYSTDDHTTLAGPLAPNSNTITVTDASKLPVPKEVSISANGNSKVKPGVIWINSERIEYSKINGNKLVDVVRGTKGTTPIIHGGGVDVYSGDKHIPNAVDTGFWNNSSTSLMASTTEQATYLKNGE